MCEREFCKNIKFGSVDVLMLVYDLCFVKLLCCSKADSEKIIGPNQF